MKLLYSYLKNYWKLVVLALLLAAINQTFSMLDPYAGVGSTLVAAAMHGRRTMGSEKERKYHKIILERLEALHKGNLKLRPLGKPVHIPSGNEKVARIPEEWEKKVRRK